MEQLTLDKEILNADLKEYFELKAKKEELEAKMKPLNAKIVKALEDMGEKKYSSDEYSAQVSYKESIKYGDEADFIGFIHNECTTEESKLYLMEALNKDVIGKAIKTNPDVATFFNGQYTITTSSSLTVKKI